MASLRAFVTLSVCLLLAHQTFGKNDAPCQRSKWNNAYNTFIKRHIRSSLPETLDQNLWEAYIKNNGGCDRPTQSFLHQRDLDRVKAVCTDQGGAVYKENLCISRQPFNFVTVRSVPGTCGIKSVREETKHLILACEELSNQCLPVHFEGNSDNSKPNNNARGCGDPDTRADAPSFKMTWLWLLPALLLLIIYGHQH
ncbi:angiogenin-2 [Sebastes umbrosus]|uniref:angiogenin-2 n=1 Tax=Sebastes umbrosus TaxID=72105 RepID=UPI00189CC3A5|nr:angiogenin-2 [Sebastes umbrosus]XP_037639729.1 angiogenin-2 [Sebastes umbrosus]XP_037639730.1 angiogenin-2 [Sebastes umbrosus]